MSLDKRRPALVTNDFHERLAKELAPLGFVAHSKAFVRKQMKATHRIEMSSSHHNAPGNVTCWIALTVTDTEIARVEEGWRAGGQLGGADFQDEPPQNVADRASANELVERVRRRLSFFDLVDDARAVLTGACQRYVPGIFDPRVLVPYLRVRLGDDAVKEYARALLAGRPELWPAFAGARAGALKPRAGIGLDHGAQLALALAKLDVALTDDRPRDAIESSDPACANLRSFFGLQLRAWGEVEAAGALRRIPDARIKKLRHEQEQLTGTIVDNVEYVMIVLREVRRDARAPRRKAPRPRLFQYHVLHDAFGPRAS
jgi:hypothetical protein